MSKHTQQPDLPDLLLNEAKAVGLQEMLLHTPLVVGVSGGADSLALLHVLCKLRGDNASRKLHVAHLDHGIRGAAAAREARCVAEIANEWGLPSTVQRFDVPAYADAQRLSLETAARRARYAFLAGIANTTRGTVTVAHNADDQAETVLMHILRGSGTSGLGGMRASGQVPVPVADSALAELLAGARQPTVRVFRPLLPASRALVESYCRQHSLKPSADASNLDTTYRRNRVRHDILPALQEHYPSVKAHLNDLARIAAAENEALEELTEQEWRQRVGLTQVGEPLTVSITGFASLPLWLRRRFARRALTEVAGTLNDFSFDHVENTASVLGGGSGSLTAVDLPHGIRVRREKDTAVAYIHNNESDEANAKAAMSCSEWPYMLAGETPLSELPTAIDLSTGWRLEADERPHKVGQTEHGSQPNEYLALFDAHTLRSLGTPTLRTRLPGDIIQPFGMRGHKSLQDLFVDAKIPREARDHVALITLAAPQHEVLWVPGPGGRRSGLAPVTESTLHVLSLKFVMASAPK